MLFHFTRSKVFVLVAVLLAAALVLGGCQTPDGPTPVGTVSEPSPAATELPGTPELPEATELPAATAPGTEAPAGETPAIPTTGAEPSPTPEHLVIEPGTVGDLQEAGVVQESGANDFAWVAEGAAASAPVVALAKEDEVALYDLAPEALTETIDALAPMQLTAAPEQRLMAWAGEDSQVHVWDTAQNAEVQVLDGGDAPVTGLALSAQGDLLAAATFDNQLRTWEATTGAELQTWELPYFLTDLSFSPDGTLLAGVDPPNLTVHIFSVATQEEVRTLTWEDTASPVLYGAFFSPDWTQVAWVARGTVQIMEVETGALGPTLGHEDFVSGLNWSPDGRLVATAAAATVAENFSPVAILWDAQSGQALNTLVLPEPAISISFSPDGRQLGTLLAGGELQNWAVAP